MRWVSTPPSCPPPRADGDREALRILLCAREELTTTSTGQINRLRALLRDGDDTDRRLARARLPDATLASLARRHPGLLPARPHDPNRSKRAGCEATVERECGCAT
jgi:hypothetical protein